MNYESIRYSQEWRNFRLSWLFLPLLLSFTSSSKTIFLLLSLLPHISLEWILSSSLCSSASYRVKGGPLCLLEGSSSSLFLWISSLVFLFLGGSLLVLDLGWVGSSITGKYAFFQDWRWMRGRRRKRRRRRGGGRRGRLGWKWYQTEREKNSTWTITGLSFISTCYS